MPLMRVNPNRMVKSGQVELICEAPSSLSGFQCTFYTHPSRQMFTHTNSSGHMCVLPVRGTDLLAGLGAGALRTEVRIYCVYRGSGEGEINQSEPSQNVTVAVWDTDTLTNPLITVHQTHLDVGQKAIIRCIADHADHCLFFSNQTLIRRVSYSSKHKFCHLSVSVDELVGDREFMGKAALLVSCAVEVTLGKELNHTSYSDVVSTSVTDRLLLRPLIEVYHNVTNKQDPVQMTCVSENGTGCSFYRGYENITWSPYSEELGGCRVSVLGVDLLGERDGEGGAEVQLRCAVEVEVGGEVLPSRLSHAVTLEISAHAEVPETHQILLCLLMIQLQIILFSSLEMYVEASFCFSW
ncbi:hypothetical protein JZ751_012073 [Albula glossodonta]|uniref:Uncharacterized protein n=1 Tax=Albula glossodonta TaxID=121402 RepID=A0A8T2PRJ2_9TELE|nr:hypothetical protein JZ751_012073 [Albula glossodonta]